MLFFKPTYVFNDITGITVRFLKKKHIRGIILDIDNTLTTHNNPIPQKSSIDWLTRVKKAGIKLIIVSNNKPPEGRSICDVCLSLIMLLTAESHLPME